MSEIVPNFQFFLTLGCLVTGVIWLADRFYFRRRRVASGAELNWAVELLRSLFPVLLVVLVVRSFIVEPFRIPSKSMVPTLLVGDFVLVSKFSYGLRLPITHTEIWDTGRPHRGDVAVFRYPPNPSIDYIKRIIGLPGDTITYKNEQLYINGKAVPRKDLGTYNGPDANLYRQMQLFVEHLPDAPTHKMLHIDGVQGPQVFKIKVPRGDYFAMGDNRDNSSDSRVWGFVPTHDLVGRAFMIWFSMNFSDWHVRWDRIGKLLH